MSTPHERINFNLRPAKRIERKLVVESLASIYRYDSPRNFGYVGMGSYYFSDFTLMHRAFGIDCMISIERDTENQPRFDFNKPYECVNIEYGTTHEKLPGLDIFNKRPVICWLDYYDPLNEAILGDVEEIATRAKPGSALVMTLACAAVQANKVSEYFLALPASARTAKNREAVMTRDGLHKFMLSQIENRLQSVLARLSGIRSRVVAKRILNLQYRDGMTMATYGWLFLDDARLAKLEAAPPALDTPAIAKGDAIYEITAPPLTFKEIAHLKTLLPKHLKPADYLKKALPVQADHAESFARFYRYYPAFADVEE